MQPWRLVLIGLVLASIAVVYLALRGGGDKTEKRADDPPKAAGKPGSAAVVPSTSGGPSAPSSSPSVGPERPTLTGSRSRPTLAGSMPTSDRFTKEKRDEAWAPARESAIRAQIDSLSLPGSVTVSAIECRAALCRMSLSGTVSGEFQRSLERLQGPDGFYKRAQQMHVANYTRGANGKPSSLTIYLEYGR